MAEIAVYRLTHMRKHRLYKSKCMHYVIMTMIIFPSLFDFVLY